MASPWLPQNPGIGGLKELTSTELAVVQSFGSLGDPNADRILFWDDSAGSFAYLTLGSGLSITDTTISATGTIDGSGVANRITYWVDTDTIGGLDTATYPSLSELAFLKGVTSAIQSQLDSKLSTSTAASTYQPLDGDLTAIAALSGTNTIYYRSAANTWTAVTIGSGLSFAGGTLSASGGSGATTALDNLASVAINTSLIPGTSDGAALGSTTKMWSDLFLASGGVINFNNGDVTLTHSANLLAFAGATSGYTFDDEIMPSINDGAALGTPTTSWADLFLASGAVISFANNNVVLTHSSGILTVSTGDLRVTTAGTNTASVVTVGGTQTLTNKTLTDPRFADLGFIADANGNELIIFDTVTSAVNEITFANAATGNAPTFSATGGDTNININLTPKGTGVVAVSTDLTVSDEAYGAGWNGSLEVPTKNAVYDKIETLGGGAPGWSFVSYSTSTSGLSITLSSLDLSANKYKVLYETENDGSSNTILARINGITTSSYIQVGRRTYRGASTGSEDLYSETTSWAIQGNQGYKSFNGEMIFSLVKQGTAGTARVQYTHKGMGLSSASSNDYFQNYDSCGHQNSQTNMTSLELRWDNTTNANWRVWLFKAATS